MMAFIAPLLPALGTAFSVGSAVLGTVSAISQANYQAKVAENNAKIAAENAKLASDQAQNEQLNADKEAAALIGQQESIQGGSGLSIDGGSQLRTRRTANKLAEQDRFNIREAGNRQIQNFLQQSENFSSEASSYKAQAKGSLIAGFLDVGKSLVNSADKVRNPNRFGAGKNSVTRALPSYSRSYV
jgi:hypothetical protein